MLMNAHKDWLDVVTTALTLLGTFYVLVWMDLSYYQTTALVLVMNALCSYIECYGYIYHRYRLSQQKQPYLYQNLNSYFIAPACVIAIYSKLATGSITLHMLSVSLLSDVKWYKLLLIPSNYDWNMASISGRDQIIDRDLTLLAGFNFVAE